MVAGNIFNTIAAAKSIVQVHGSATGNKKYVANAMGNQGMGNVVCDSDHLFPNPSKYCQLLRPPEVNDSLTNHCSQGRLNEMRLCNR